jgi:hypothetical protein
VSDDDRRRFITRSGAGLGTILVDGFVRGTWKIAPVRDGAALATADAGAHEMRFKQPD